MSTEITIEDRIDAAADAVGAAWPLHSFVTANPLSGFEDRPFHEAVADAERLLGGDGYPSPATFRRAWADGRIDLNVLREELDTHGYDTDPKASLDAMAAAESADDPEAPSTSTSPATERVDAVLTKWLAAFLDQGQAEWPMPDRERGFYDAFRAVARHDGDLPEPDAIAALPDDPIEAVREHLDGYHEDDWEEILEFHLVALPGWTGLIKQRVGDADAWQSAYPITLAGYLAARLALVDQFDAPLTPDEASDSGDDAGSDPGSQGVPLPEVWLTAWEETYRDELTESVADASERLAESSAGDARDGDPDAQLVFCIDTRSEIIRRHVEAAGDYETHGYAGFFGVPMRYDGYGSDVTVDACPPIVDAEHHISDRPVGAGEDKVAYDSWHATLETVTEALEDLRSNAATAFSFVESAGAGYGVGLALRTLLPARFHDLLDAADRRIPDIHDFCEPDFGGVAGDSNELPAGLPLEKRVEYAATAFELMGWEEFARVVVFAGHASETANNPFDASLDCGACAGNPGGPSARVLAAICNDDAVRAELRERGIEIPDDTVFVAGEHNTTTDEVTLYADDIPETHTDDIEQLRADLETARAGAAAERATDMGRNAEADSGVRETERRAADWAETRPEWGLAGNAGFVIGPRELTAGLDLDGRSFLHSYDWQTDPDGDALEAILTGPMVVTQWINAQYYFATVDTAVYGSGSKVTQNPVGNVGVYQGNGGDLMTGLPRQSVMAADEEPYHQPLRLSTVVHAPTDRVTEILADHDDLATLLDNGWLSLSVVDPKRDHRAFHYAGDLEWTPMSPETEPEREPEREPKPAPALADD